MGRPARRSGRPPHPRGAPGGEEQIEDDHLRLVIVACHPIASLPSRVALTLRLVGRLSTVEIARANVVPEPTIARRIVRAKRAIARAGAPFEAPEGEERVIPEDAEAHGLVTLMEHHSARLRSRVRRPSWPTTAPSRGSPSGGPTRRRAVRLAGAAEMRRTS